MLNQLAKFALLASIWMWLRPRWRGLAVLVAVILSVNILHGEYLDYVELSGNQGFLVISYLVKWTALITTLIGYLVIFAWGAKVKQRDSKQKNIPEPNDSADSQTTDDGFNFLREKNHLMNRAEKILDEKRSVK